MHIENNCMITLSYRIESEHEMAVPYPKGPFRMQVLVGYDRLLPALEEALLGMSEGDHTCVVVPPEALFGAMDEEVVTSVPLDKLVDPSGLKVGHIHHIMDENSSLKPFRVVEIGPESVLADFNHRLSSHPIRFNIRIEEVRWATLDEIKQVLQPVTSTH